MLLRGCHRPRTKVVDPTHDTVPRQAYRLEDLGDTSRLPRGIFCPIVNLPMADPVVAADGHSYERAAITRWLQSKRTSPLTGAYLPHTQLVPNHSLRCTVAELVTSSAH